MEDAEGSFGHGIAFIVEGGVDFGDFEAAGAVVLEEGLDDDLGFVGGEAVFDGGTCASGDEVAIHAIDIEGDVNHIAVGHLVEDAFGDGEGPFLADLFDAVDGDVMGIEDMFFFGFGGAEGDESEVFGVYFGANVAEVLEFFPEEAGFGAGVIALHFEVIGSEGNAEGHAV